MSCCSRLLVERFVVAMLLLSSSRAMIITLSCNGAASEGLFIDA